jgi:N-acetylmuramoyl-L-alanine amidase
LIFFFYVVSLPVFGNTADDPFILVIDPGHGGVDPGALGKNSKEKTVNFAVAMLVGEYIENEHPDVKIVYTRKTDVKIELRDRTSIANNAKANLFISIHSNASENHSRKGSEVYILGLHRTEDNLRVAKRENDVILLEKDYKQKYQGFDPKSSESNIIYELMQNNHLKQSYHLASLIQKELVGTAKRKNNEVRQAGFWVLVGASMPAVLVELDYISNPESEQFISSKAGQEKLARAIANAFSEYKKSYDDTKKKTTSSSQKTETEVADSSSKVSSSSPISSQTPTSAQQKQLVYKVQIFAILDKLPANSRQFKGYKTDYYVENNLYKYTYGESSDWDEISRIRKSLLKDFKDAFIVKFVNGVKTPIK